MQSRPWIDIEHDGQETAVSWYTENEDTRLGTLVIRRDETTTRHHPVAEGWYTLLKDGDYRFRLLLSAATCTPRPPAHVTRAVGTYNGRIEQDVRLTATRLLSAGIRGGVTLDGDTGKALAATSVAIALGERGEYDAYSALNRVSSVTPYKRSRLMREYRKLVKCLSTGVVEKTATIDEEHKNHQIPARIEQGEPSKAFETSCENCGGSLVIDAVQHEQAYGEQEGAAFTHSSCGSTEFYQQSSWTQRTSRSGMSE